jgi:hypothetical protein
MFSVQHCKTPTNYSLTARIITKLTSIGVFAPTYFHLSSHLLGAPFNLHKFLFCVDDMNCYMGGTKRRYVMDIPVVPLIWHVQEGINLSHNKVKALKETNFVFYKQQPILPRSLFVKENSITINQCNVVAQNA